jgi:hypothetical protein
MAVADGQFNVMGKLFVITGGDKGLGFQTAKRLVRETWRRSNCFFSSREFLHFNKLLRDRSEKLGEDQTGFFFSGILAFYRTDKRMVRETWRRSNCFFSFREFLHFTLQCREMAVLFL